MAGGIHLHIGREACSSKNLAKEHEQCCPVPLGGTGVEYRQIGDRKAMARTRIGLDQIIDTCVGQRLFEAVFLFFGKRRILDGHARDIDPAADVFDSEEMRTVRLIGRQIAPMERCNPRQTARETRRAAGQRGDVAAHAIARRPATGSLSTSGRDDRNSMKAAASEIFPVAIETGHDFHRISALRAAGSRQDLGRNHRRIAAAAVIEIGQGQHQIAAIRQDAGPSPTMTGRMPRPSMKKMTAWGQGPAPSARGKELRPGKVRRGS